MTDFSLEGMYYEHTPLPFFGVLDSMHIFRHVQKAADNYLH